MTIADTILMIRPAAFGYNEETAGNNFFQSPSSLDPLTLQQIVVGEFDNMVDILRENDIEVLVIEDSPSPPKPDAIFPNNWISTSPESVVSVFPMYAQSRRPEKTQDILDWLNKEFQVNDLHDWSEFEADGKFLEGTGSMVIDHQQQMIYASASPRTSVSLLEKFASANGYQAIVFVATDLNGNPVYHTNVVMSLGDEFAIFCEESIDEEWELIAIRQLLESSGKTIIPITRQQMHAYAGNMLLLLNKKGDKILVMSQTAFDSLRKEQVQMLEAYAQLLPILVTTIEKVEGGSVRCMMAEIFLKRRY